MAKLGKIRSINEFDLASHRSFALNASLDIFIFKMHFLQQSLLDLLSFRW